MNRSISSASPAILIACLIVLALSAAAARAGDVPQPDPPIAPGAWEGVLEAGEHPRLFGSRDHLRELARIKPELYAEIKGHDSIVAVGVVHAVEGADRERIEPHLEEARKNVERGMTNRHQSTHLAMEQVALAYDFFHDELSSEERAEWIAWFNAHLGPYTADEGAFHNSTSKKLYTMLCAGYATWGENPRAEEFRDYALEYLYEDRVLPVLLEFGAGGGYTEAGWYERSPLWSLVEAMELARRIEGYDGFAKAPRFYYQRLAYEMFHPYPGLWLYGSERYPAEGDGSYLYSSAMEYPRYMRTLLAQYFRGSPLARAIANKRREGSNASARLFDFLYQHKQPLNEPLPLEDFKLAHIAPGVGDVFARTDWSDDATWFRFNCGDYWSGHQHFDVGNFEIYRHEPLATESGEYVNYTGVHAMNWLVRTIAHNCILVYDPEETWTNMRDGKDFPYANDGGQAKKWDWTKASLEQWMENEEQFERGDIVAYDSRPAFLYVAGDCTAAYSPAKLDSWVRQIVFIRPHTFVIFDRVVSTRPEYEKTWLLHSVNEPVIDGRKALITHGEGRLTVRTLLPADPRIRSVEGYTYRGQTFQPSRETGLSENARLWRIEVRPDEPSEKDLFLHVLSTSDQPPAEVELTRRGGRVGARIDGVEVLFMDGEVGGTLRMDGERIALEPGLKLDSYERPADENRGVTAAAERRGTR